MQCDAFERVLLVLPKDNLFTVSLYNNICKSLFRPSKTVGDARVAFNNSDNCCLQQRRQLSVDIVSPLLLMKTKRNVQLSTLIATSVFDS